MLLILFLFLQNGHEQLSVRLEFTGLVQANVLTVKMSA